MTNLERGMGSKAYEAAMRKAMKLAAGGRDEPMTWKGDLDADGNDEYSNKNILRENETRSSPMLFDEKRQSNSAMRQLYESYPEKAEGDILARELLQSINQGEAAFPEGIPESVRGVLKNIITTNNIGHEWDDTEQKVEDALIRANINLAGQTQPIQLPTYRDLIKAEPNDSSFSLNDSTRALYAQLQNEALVKLKELELPLDSPLEREAGYYLGLSPIAIAPDEGFANSTNTMQSITGRYPTVEDLDQGILGVTPMYTPLGGMFSILHSHPNKYKEQDGEWRPSREDMKDRAQPSTDDQEITDFRNDFNEEMGMPRTYDYVTGTPIPGRKIPVPFYKY